MPYIVSVVVILAAYIFMNWYDQMDLSLGDLFIFTVIACVPIVNVCFLVYMIIMTFCHVSFNDFPTITILRGKE